MRKTWLRRASVLTTAMLASSSWLGCGSAQVVPASPEPAAPAQPGEVVPSDAKGAPSEAARAEPGDANDEAEMDAMLAEISAEAGADPRPESSSAAVPEQDERPLTGRDITYRVTPKGLVIEIDGVHLRPRAKPFKKKHGGYALELSLEVISFDGRDYWLRNPKEGPLGLAGKVETKKGKSTRFQDVRRGDDELLIRGGEGPVVLEQEWPGKGQPQLWWGETLTLEVGLWGLKMPGESRYRPISRLFTVKMLGTNDPQPVISPPTMDWGS